MPLRSLLLSLPLVFAMFCPVVAATDSLRSPFSDAAEFLNQNDEGLLVRKPEDCRERSIKIDGGPAFKAYTFEGDQGYVITDERDRVVAFSNKGDFPDPAGMSGHPALEWLKWCRSALDAGADGPEGLPNLTSRSKASPVRGNVRALLTSSWDQYCGYNDYCPVDSAGSCLRTCAGDLAVAMAQVMRYFKYPASGNSMLTYNLPVYGDITAIFSQAFYDYAAMPDHPYVPYPEVSELIFHCGVAMRTAYNPDFSDAEIQQLPYVLRQFFSYDYGVHYLHSAGWDPALWKETVQEELAIGRPVIYEGRGTSKHIFICDGCWGNDWLHFNWGWGGLYDGYFYFPNTCPGTMNFTLLHAAVFGIMAPVSPQAFFSADITEVIPGEKVNFSDASKGCPYEWDWHFEDANTPSSIVNSPQGIIWADTGRYDVGLVVSNGYGSDTLVMENLIHVSPFALPSANFKLQDTMVCPGMLLSLSLDCRNAVDSIVWIISPGSFTAVGGLSAPPGSSGIIFHQPGKYSLRLAAHNINGWDTTAEVRWVRVGGLDAPFAEGFEHGKLSGRWKVVDDDMFSTWDTYFMTKGVGDGRKSAWMHFAEYPFPFTGARDQLISPPIDLRSLSSPSLGFRHACVMKSITDSNTYFNMDTLIVRISGDCGDTWTTLVTMCSGTEEYATVFSDFQDFVPDEADDWCGQGWGSPCLSFDLSPWGTSSSVRIMFEAINRNGNNWFIDDVSIGEADTVNSINNQASTSSIRLFPNPANDRIHIALEPDNPVDQAQFFDLTGRIISSVNLYPSQSEFSISVKDFKPGMYLLILQGATSRLSQRFLIQH
jgi:PKD repeat protein